MKTILGMLFAALVAYGLDYEVAAFGLVLSAIVLMIGDMAGLPPCDQNCNQGRGCTCKPESDRSNP